MSGDYVGKFGSVPAADELPSVKLPSAPAPRTASPHGHPPPHAPPKYSVGPDEPHFRTHKFVDAQGREYEGETLQDRIVNVFGGIARSVWSRSNTVLRIDLVRPYNPKLARFEGRGEEESHDARQRARRRKRRMLGQGWEAIDGHAGGVIQGLDRGFYGNGAQLKLMQVWKFEDRITRKPKLPGALNFGFGANMNIDSGLFQPRMRLRSENVVLRLLPRPDMELRGKWRLGNTRLGLDARYRVPVLRPEDYVFKGPSVWGFLSVRLFNWEGAGFSLSPDGGLEFDEQVVRVGEHTKFRVGAKLSFPRYFPWDEDEDPCTVEFRRLGVKTIIGV